MFLDGPDSICMLNILNEISKNKINFKIFVCHINHGLRENANIDEEYVKNFCEKIEVPFFVKHVNISEIAQNTKRGLEETGRIVRYDFFDEIMKKTNSNKIATAHNNNDKVETVIMNILRGSGSNGLKGIEPIRDEKYIRPLIEITRDEIEEYCRIKKLNPKIDKSNNDNIYTRNKIRNVVIPYIKKEFNPNIIKTINRLSEVSVEENDYVNRITEKTFNDLVINDEKERISNKQIVLNLKEFNKLDLVIKRRIILYTINKLLFSTVGIEKVNIDDIIKLCSNNIGNKYLKPIKNLKILVKKGKIFFASDI